MKSAVSNRRNLTPPIAEAGQDQGAQTGQDATGQAGVHLMRRGGARREVSARVALRSVTGDDLRYEGWALNVSRGGVRAILEEKLELGQEFEIDVGDPNESPSRRGRVVWVQEEPDGVIVGIEFVGLSGTHKSAPPPPPDAAPEVNCAIDTPAVAVASDEPGAAPAAPAAPAAAGPATPSDDAEG